MTQHYLRLLSFDYEKKNQFINNVNKVIRLQCFILDKNGFDLVGLTHVSLIAPTNLIRNSQKLNKSSMIEQYFAPHK